MKIIIIIISLCFFNYFEIEAQASWRFPIAFEDAIGAKDTVWMIWDTTATGGFNPFVQVDTSLGEGPFNFDYSQFNVWIYNTAGDSTKTFALPFTYFPNHGLEVRAFNYQYPITVSWDTSLFHSPILPAQPGIGNAKIDNDYFFGINNDPPAQMFNMLWDNHVLAPAFSFGSQSQFPMSFYLSGFTNIIQPNIIENEISIAPNPASDFFWFEYHLTNSAANGDLLIYNTLGELIIQITIYPYFNTIKVESNNLKDGIYYLTVLQKGKRINSGKFIKQ